MRTAAMAASDVSGELLTNTGLHNQQGSGSGRSRNSEGRGKSATKV
jgi:hypothetical protein